MTEAEKREKIQVIHYCSYCGDNKIKEYNDKELNYFYCETCGKTQDYEVQKGKPPRRIITKISLILMIFGRVSFLLVVECFRIALLISKAMVTIFNNKP